VLSAWVTDLITTALLCLDAAPGPCAGVTLASCREPDDAVPAVAPHRGEPQADYSRRKARGGAEAPDGQGDHIWTFEL
jgi:hypothetical protein